MKEHLDRGRKRIQELQSILEQSISQQEQINTLVELAWEFRMSQPEQSSTLSERSSQLSQSGEFAAQPYARGMAGSLVNLAFVETYTGKLDSAVTKCLQALSLLEQEATSAITVDAWYTLSWISFFLGDYPTAMEHGQKALKMSHTLGLKIHEAWTLDAIASIHGASQDFPAGVQTHKASLDLFRDLNDIDGEIRSLNNLAYTYYLMKEYPAALEAGLSSLRLTQKLEASIQSFNVYCTVAQILIDMQQWDQAEGYLKEALTGLQRIGTTNVTEVYVLMEWGRLALIKNELQAAESYYLKALAHAEQIDHHPESALCHQKLSEVHERLNQFPSALEHYKAFHAIHETVTGEQSAKRLAVLNITYKVEATQHEKEIYRLQTIQLQREMDEQKRIQDILENLSRVDSLTGVFNRRMFDERLEQEYARHCRSGAMLTLIMLDIDHFKAYNDTYGHVQGDECLKRVSQAITWAGFRPADFVGRYGGEEFACILPETNAAGALVVAEKIRRGIIELAIPHRTAKTAEVVTISLGVITARCTPHGSAIDLVTRADEQLYAAKSGGRNRVETAVKLN